MSFPEGASVNDAIDSALCSIEYTSVEQVAEAALKIGSDSLLAKNRYQACPHTNPSQSSRQIHARHGVGWQHVR